MTKKKATRQGSKASSSKAAAAHRYALFVEAYLVNGRNATQAAISAGYSQKTAYAQGHRITKMVHVWQMIEARTRELNALCKLDVEKTLREVARIAYFDPAKMYDGNNALKKMVDIDVDTRGAMAGIESTPILQGGKVVGVKKKPIIFDKNAALDKAMRHLGLYERDNKQLGDGFAERLVKARERVGKRAA